MFPTTSGKQIGASNLRRRVLAPAIELANARLADVRETPGRLGLTPHSLRRTFASVLYALGETPVDVQGEMGHTDPKLALAIYAHTMRRDQDERERLRARARRRSRLGSQWAAGAVWRRWPRSRAMLEPPVESLAQGA